MPQVFQVLRCYKCFVFQIHQRKKSNKWECKICGEKQSIKRHYGLGTGLECRKHVQKLNGIRGEIDQLNTNKSLCSDEYSDDENNYISQKTKVSEGESKWSEYIDNPDIHDEEASVETIETMYLGNKEVVLEIPKKQLQKHFGKKGKKQNRMEYIDYKEKCTKFVDDANLGNRANLAYRQDALQTPSSCTPKVSVNFTEKNFISQNKNLRSQVEHENNENNLYVDEKKYNNTIFDEVMKERKRDTSMTTKFQHENRHRNKQNIAEYTINKNNSKWNQFINDKESYHNITYNTARNNNENINMHDETITAEIGSTNRKSGNLFSLCNDNDLDIVLDI